MAPVAQIAVRAAAACLLAGSTVVTTVGAAPAAVHGLVVGINEYVGAGELFGAVNDAEDVAAALRASGAASVTMLTDRQATRERVFAEWQAMVERSAEGDLLIFHFAGHGINEPDTDGDEPDGQDESYLLADYDDFDNPADRIVDDELDSWLSMATDAGRKVMFVADACHSGSPTRSIFGAALPTRFYVPRTQPERPRPLVDTGAVETIRSAVFSVGATLDNRTVPEILIEDRPRGALSYAVARALEGDADLDRDGTVVAGEFEAFVRQNVRNFASSKQTPQFEIPDESFPIVTSGRLIEVVPDDSEATIRIHVRSGADDDFRSAIAAFDGVVLSDDESAAALVYDPATGTLANNVRDAVAHGLDLEGLKTAIEADRALHSLKRIARHGTLPIAFTPDDGEHAEGTAIGFTVPAVAGRYLTIFDLTATGSVHFLWPLGPGDSDPYNDGSAFSLNATVTPPFGADTLVVLATEVPPQELRAELKRIDGRREPAALMKSLEAAVADQPYRIALQSFFTRAQ